MASFTPRLGPSAPVATRGIPFRSLKTPNSLPLRRPSVPSATQCRPLPLSARAQHPNASPASSSVTTTPPPASAEALWASFGAAASGEWAGVTVTFNRDGEAQELPEYYVPQAYRDWDVKIHDWQSQCSMLADNDGLQYTLRRLMPTVGCEADAVAFTEDSLFVEGATAAMVTPEGGYTRAPAVDLASTEVFAAQAEHCFPLEAAGQRIRVVHSLKRMGSDRVWKVAGIEVHRERFDTPHNGRRELAGCGGGLDPFALKVPLDAAAALAGSWVAQGTRFAGGTAAEAVEGSVFDVAALPGALVGLPLGVWSAVNLGGSSGDVDIATGVVLEGGNSVKAAVQRIRGGVLLEAQLLTLSKA